MNLKELVYKNRSFRRFKEEYVIDRGTLVELVDLAQHSASGANRQPLKFFLSCDRATNSKIFTTTRWAAYLKSWEGPEPGERPSAYIVILGDKRITDAFGVDHGIAAQSIMLGAAERELGGCIIGSVQRIKLQRDLNLPDHYQILLVLALGKPNEKVVIESVQEDGGIQYWRDEEGVHHVPKRSLDSLIIG